MKRLHSPLLFRVLLVGVVGLTACGSDDASGSADAEATLPAATENAPEETKAPDDDHGDEAEFHDDDHGDDDHGDDDHDDKEHDDHGDDDHDEEHGDEEHADEHADDKDHDDHDDDEHADDGHGDEEHDDEEHDDHGDDKDHDDHGDEDHDHDDAGGGLDAHEHGVADMTVAWLGTTVDIELISPAFNIFGFEYEAETETDLAIEAEQTETITGAGIVMLDSAAACELVAPAATSVEREGSHSEITVSWKFACERPDEISEVDAAGLFESFPNLEDVDVQWISDTSQSSAELNPSTTKLSLQG